MFDETVDRLDTAIKLRASFWLMLNKGIIDAEMEIKISNLIKNMKSVHFFNEYILNNYASSA